MVRLGLTEFECAIKAKTRFVLGFGLSAFLALQSEISFAHAGHSGSHDTKGRPHRAARSTLKAAEGSHRVFFIEPKAESKLKSPIQVRMGLEGYKIGPIGDLTEGLGHHHLLIDRGPIEKGAVVPMDEKHIHFGKGQTETTVDLKPGRHTLTLQFADGAHRSYGPELSASIEVVVESDK